MKKMILLKSIFLFFVVAVLLVFFFGQLFLPQDAPAVYGICEELETESVVIGIGEDGYSVAEVHAVLPAQIKNGVNCLYLRGREMTVRVGGELRADYHSQNDRKYGSTGAAYVEVPISQADAGREVDAHVALESATVSVIYLCNHIGFWLLLFRQYGAELVIGIIALFLGLICVVGGAVVGVMHRRYTSLIDLGLGAALAASWVITNSVFRQFIFHNISLTSSIPYFIISLMSFPFVYYVNDIQKGRYEKLFTVVQILNITDIVMCCIVYGFDLAEMVSVFPYIAFCSVLSIVSIMVTFLIDLVQRRIGQYRLAAMGIFCALASGAIQILLFFNRKGVFSGSVLATGLIFVVLFSLFHAFNDFERMTKETQSAIASNQAKDAFLANMSHEIRTPINAILGMDEMIIRESREEKIQGYARDVRNAGRSLLEIINDILDFSKIESGRMDIIPVKYDVRSLLHDIMLMIRIKAEEKGLELVLEADPQIPSFLYGDLVRLKQVIVNLLSNAVKYTERGRITWRLAAVREGEDAILSCEVRDTGIGMKPEDMATLFERFVRVEQRRNYNVEGTGLGLAITSQLLTLMGSRLDVESKYGEGSVFSFELRQGIVNAEPIGEIGNIEEYIVSEETEDVKAYKGSGRLLVTDDQRMNREVLKNLLKGSGLQIDEADSGEACLALAGEHTYDMIFLDHMMPGMDGIETLQHLREDGAMRGRPAVISLTANAVSGAREEYLTAGFDDYLTKPVMPEALNKILLRWMPKQALQELPEAAEAQEQEESALLRSLEELPELNVRYAFQFYQNEEQYLDSLRDFYDMIETMADELDDEVLKLSAMGREETSGEALMAQMKAVRIRAHSMKSASAAVGAMQLSGTAALLENAAKEEKRDAVLAVSPHFLDAWLSFHDKLSAAAEHIGGLDT